MTDLTFWDVVYACFVTGASFKLGEYVFETIWKIISKRIKK